MAGTVVDGMLASSAGAAVGVNTGKPKLGGSLSVGLMSDVPNYHVFSGSLGKMDASGFCVANAVFDSLFCVSADGKSALPMLALSATPNSNYTQWTITLRQGVTFHNGDAFNADVVVANWQAANADQTVGLAIKPMIGAVTKVDTYTVLYTMVIPYSTLPMTLAEQQIGYMANWPGFMSTPTKISASQGATGTTYSGNPIGTGPFEFVSWTLNSQSQWKKNTKYWRKDAAGRQLPYLSNLTFKVIPDPSSRNQALQSGSVDMIWTQDNPSIKALGSMKGITYRTDANDSRSPAVNCLLLNTSGTLNQYFAWAGQFAALGIPGSLSYLLQGQTPPALVQQHNLNPAPGAVDPTTLTWNPALKPVLNDINVRKALAMALNRQTYHSAIENNVGQISDGIYRPNSPFYKNPGYPSYNQAKAKSMIDAYKQANGLSSVGFVIDIVSGDAAAQKQFAFFSAAFSAIGVTVTPRPLVQSTLINNVIAGEFDCATWNQFGGNDPATNYVWFVSTPAAASLASGGLGMSSLPSNINIPGAVNFAHLGDPDVERDMLAGLAAAPGTAAHVSNWSAVNTQFAQDIPYLYLDYTLTAFAARSNVQNWGRAVAGDGHTAAQQFSGGSAKWESIWKS